MAHNASRSTIRCGMVQFTHRPSDKVYNMTRIRAFVAEAASAGVKLLVFPEMCITGYWHVIKMDRSEIAALAERVPDDPSTKALAELAKQHAIVIGAGLIEADGDRFYNSYVVVEPDGRHVVHRKLHAFENPHITPGGRYTVFESSLGCRIGVLTCYDNNLIENVRIT